MRTVSASSIELWTMCRRRWAFSYLAGQWEPSGKNTEAGKRVHRLLELSRDEEPWDTEPWEGYDITRMARALWKHKPDDEAIAFEDKFAVELFGIPFKGVVDRRSGLYLLDWKSTGGLLKYAKTPTKLKRDVQRLVYANAFPDIRYSLWVTGTWASSEAALADPDTQPFDTVASLLENDPKRDVEAFKLHVLTPAEEIVSVPDGIEPLSFALPDNALSPYNSPCKKFPPDKCPHFNTCHKTRTLSSALRGEKKMGLVQALQELAAERESSAAPAPVPVAVSDTREYLVENLYVDCIPLFKTPEPILYAHTLIARAMPEVESQYQVAHPLLLDFAKGPPLVSLEVIAQLEEMSETVPHLYLETKSALGRGVMDSLISRSRNVYKGMF